MGAAGPYWVTAHPVSWPPYEWPVGDDRQISSQDQRSVKLRVRPPLTGTHRCHEATPTGRGIMLTVKLRLAAVFDAQPGGFATGWSPVSWGSIDELFDNLTMPRTAIDDP